MFVINFYENEQSKKKELLVSEKNEAKKDDAELKRGVLEYKSYQHKHLDFRTQLRSLA